MGNVHDATSSKLGSGCRKGALGNESGAGSEVGVSKGCIHMLKSVRGEASVRRLKGLIVSGDIEDVATECIGGSEANGGRWEGGTTVCFLTGGGGM